MNIDLLKRLTEAHGIPSREDAIREIVKEELGDLCKISCDRIGNTICYKKGEGGPKLMIAAHMDEIGFIVKFIDGSGFLRLQPMGGWDPAQMASQRVLVHTRDEALAGTLMASKKPKHMLSDAELKSSPSLDDYFVDLGFDAETVKQRVRIGDMVTMNRGFQHTGENFTCKAMDDRSLVFVMIEALRAAKSHKAEVYAVATVQEEVGLRGARACGEALRPDIMIALDVTLANDFPGIPEQDQVTRLGEGVAIKIRDNSLICHPKLVEHFREIAERHGIKYQMEVLPAGGTDAGAVHTIEGGVPSITISLPCRYVHTVNETVNAKDLQATIDLVARYIEEAHEGQYGYA